MLGLLSEKKRKLYCSEMLCGIFMVKIQDMSTLNVGNGCEGIHYTLLDSYV